MAPIVDKLCENQRREGAFRKQHLEVAANAENIAFIRDADKAEHKQSEKLLSKLIHVRTESRTAIDVRLTQTA